jgi:hypothetical protein
MNLCTRFVVFEHLDRKVCQTNARKCEQTDFNNIFIARGDYRLNYVGTLKFSIIFAPYFLKVLTSWAYLSANIPK